MEMNLSFLDARFRNMPNGPLIASRKLDREHGIWRGMISRCHGPTPHTNYGGRGIVVHECWRDSFDQFMLDMGPRPSNRHSIDRIDTNGNYEPGNCRWALPVIQGVNRRQAVRGPVEWTADGSRALTARQLEVLKFICESIEAEGVPPSMREIGRRIGVTSTNAVNDHLRALVRKGFIETTDKAASRSIRVLKNEHGQRVVLRLMPIEDGERVGT